MAKQNRDKSFADETQQNKNATKIVQYETRKNQKKKRKKKKINISLNIVIWVIPFVIAIIDIYYGTKLLLWAEKINKRGVCLNFIAENMLNTAMLVIETLLFIGTVCLAFLKKNKGACAIVSVIMLVALYGLVATNVKVVASIDSDKELVLTNIEKGVNALSNVNAQAIYQLRQYILEEDIFMENLEQYCGIPDNSLSQNERIDKMAELILLYLQNHVDDTVDKKLPHSYETNVLLADVRYGGFSYYKEQCEKPEYVGIKKEIYDCELTELEEAINCRIKADKALPTAENRRLIGVYYIDEGILRQNISEAGSAAACYESAAEWAVKSICSAATGNDVEAMKDAWGVLNSAAIYLEDVEESSDGENVQKVKNIRDAYIMVINQWK